MANLNYYRQIVQQILTDGQPQALSFYSKEQLTRYAWIHKLLLERANTCER